MHDAKRFVIAAVVCATAVAVAGQRSRVDFEKDDAGKPASFPVAVYDSVTAKDIDLSVQFKQFGVAVVALASTAAMPPISQQVRTALDRALGVKGVYVDEESAYKFAFPRTDIDVDVGGQRLSPAQAPRSWATFSPSMHQEAFVNGEIIVVEGEVNRVLSAALSAGLDVTGLGGTLLFERPRLLTMNVSGEGTFQNLAGALRKTLDEVGRPGAGKSVSSSQGVLSPPIANTIDPAPLNGVLSMRGVVTDGIYRAAIGRVVLVNGTPIGREMGMSTSLIIFGTNERAFVQAELIVNPDELQRVLKALRARDFTVTSIRNHTVGEHPESLFIRVWKQGAASELARGLRFALDVEVGATALNPQGK
jgi:hypothetical protein